jgi:hypothetical protein
LWGRCTEVLPDNTSSQELWVSPVLLPLQGRRSLTALPGVFGARRNTPIRNGRVSKLHS